MYGFDLCDLSEYEMSIIMITAIQEVKIAIIYVLIALHI